MHHAESSEGSISRACNCARLLLLTPRNSLVPWQGKLGVPLVSNQIKFNIFDRKAEKSGLIALCKEMGVTCLAYEPLSLVT